MSNGLPHYPKLRTQQRSPEHRPTTTTPAVVGETRKQVLKQGILVSNLGSGELPAQIKVGRRLWDQGKEENKGLSPYLSR